MWLLVICALLYGAVSVSYPEYIADDARCIVQLKPSADVSTVLGPEAVSMGIPHFYTIGCFKNEQPPEPEPEPEDPDNGGQYYDGDTDEEILTYEEKIDALEKLASLDGVLGVYPDIVMSVAIPATLSNFTNVPKTAASETEGCTSPAHDFLWHITGQYKKDKDAKAIKTIDISIQDAWDKGFMGNGSIIQMLLVDGISTANADLSGRIDFEQSREFTNAALNVTSTEGTMGTALATLASGDRCNNYGGEGIAPNSTLVLMNYNKEEVLLSDFLVGLYPADYLRYLEEAETNADAAHKTTIVTTSFLLDGCTSGCCTIFDDIPWLSTIMNDAAKANSAVYLFTTGGEGHTDANIYPFLRSPAAIVVGSATPDGKPDEDITFGSNIVFTVPSNGTVDSTNLSLYTSTSPGACNDDGSADNPTGCLVGVNGPAGSLSLAAGAVSVIGQALKGNYNVRDILHIMAISSQVVNNKTQFNEKNGWILNDNGFFFSNKYGFGLLNMTNAINLAQNWAPLPDATYASYVYNETEKISSNDHVDVHITVPERDMMRLERVQIALSLATGFAGDISVEVTSPAGTVNKVLGQRKADVSDNLSDEIMLLSNAFFGEASPGDWMIRVHNAHKTSSARLTSVQLAITGVAQTTHLTFGKKHNNIYSDTIVHLKWRPTTCGLKPESFVDLWIVDRFHTPVALVASNISYNDFEYQWDAFKIPLEKATRGFFLMVPHDTANIIPHQWLPSHVYSPLVSFHLADSEPAAGAFIRPSLATTATICAILVVSAMVLK